MPVSQCLLPNHTRPSSQTASPPLPCNRNLLGDSEMPIWPAAGLPPVPAVRSVSESGAAQEPVGNMRLGLHVEQRVGVKRQLHLLRQQLATASADLQVSVVCAQQLCLFLELGPARERRSSCTCSSRSCWGCHCLTVRCCVSQAGLSIAGLLLMSGCRMLWSPSVQSHRPVGR